MTTPVRASFAQERMWFIEALDPESALYNQLICYRIKGNVDLATLGFSLDEVMRRHEALRTNLSVIEGQVYQHVLEDRHQDLCYIDLLEQATPMEAAGRMMVEEARRPFSLSSEALIRPEMFRVGHDDFLLAFITHHTIMDGWSMGLFIKELSVIYESRMAGTYSGTTLPAVPIQYRDYSIRQRNAFDSGAFEGQMGYWLKKLDGDLPVLQLPFDHPRPAVQSYSGRSYIMVVPPEMTASLKALGRKNKSTLFMVLLSAFYVLLYRYSGQDDIIVGSPIAGRNQFDIEGMIGLCINSLALRCAIAPGQTYLETLNQVRECTLEAYENQDLPFEKLVERLTVQRSLDTPPIFQALFQLRNFIEAGAVINGNHLERYEPEEVMAKVDLTLEVTESPEGLSCRFEYPMALFERETIVRMAAHWRNILESIISDPYVPASRICMLDDDELSSIMSFSKGPATGYPRESVSRIFEARVQEAPDAIAIRHGQDTLTYRELNVRADMLANHLKESGVSLGDRIAITMARSLRMVVAMLAILKAGAVYVPIDPSDGTDRIAGMLEDARPKTVIGEEYAYDGRPGCVDAGTGPDSPAYIMFTSGSTGRPKGVCIHHRGIVRLTVNTDYVTIKPGDRVAHISNPAFDAATFEVWGALLNGATLVILDKDMALSPSRLKEAIASEHIDVMFMTTPLFHTIVAMDPEAFTGIRDLIVGGDVLYPGPTAEALKRSRPVRLLNAYGPTENTTFSTCYEVTEATDSIPIGKPIAGSTAYILDRGLQPVPVGVAGEIYVGGDGVSAGYLSRPDLNEASFYPDPFNPRSKMYRTGDIGRLSPDGNISFIGRADGQVKIRGFRVETGEVVSALEGHSGVREAVVTAVSGPDGSKVLAAYLVKAGDDKVPVEELRSYLSKKLPAQMIPSGIVWIDEIPLTSRGKVDYGSLPVPESVRGNGAWAYRRHDSRMEEHLSAMSAIWGETLGLQGVNPDGDFFMLGGHSLLAIRLVSRIEDAFNVRLPVSMVFKAPTPRQMAYAVMGGHYGRDDHVMVLMKPGEGSPPIFCVHGVPGTLFDYDYMAPLLGGDRPVYGLQSPGLDGTVSTPETVGEIASVHVREICALQQHGPYHIVGYCAAAAIAYEIACQLEKAGERVGLLAVIDYDAPGKGYGDSRGPYYRFIKDNIGGARDHASAFMRSDMRVKAKKAVRLPVFLARKALRLPKEITPVAASPYPEWIMCYPEPQRSVAMACYDAIDHYSPGPYAGKVVAIVSSEKAESVKSRQGDVRLGWEKLAGDLTVHIVEGDHHSMKGLQASKAIARIIREEADGLKG